MMTVSLSAIAQHVVGQAIGPFRCRIAPNRRTSITYASPDATLPSFDNVHALT
jgi:hypothetical protein